MGNSSQVGLSHKKLNRKVIPGISTGSWAVRLVSPEPHSYHRPLA